jgi:hypothetical protein
MINQMLLLRVVCSLLKLSILLVFMINIMLLVASIIKEAFHRLSVVGCFDDQSNVVDGCV